MRNRLLQSIIVAMVALLFVATPAHAQTAQTNASPLVPRGDVFAGVAFWNEDGTSLSGFHLSGTWRAGTHIGIVGDFATYGDYSSLMGGVRAQGSGRHSMFVQVLVGKAPLDDFAIQPGLGIDVRLSRRAALRAGFDVKIAGDEGGIFIGTRLSVGLVYLIGQR
jgi:hypothetical protein